VQFGASTEMIRRALARDPLGASGPLGSALNLIAAPLAHDRLKMAMVGPFPAVRRRRFIAKTAGRLAMQSPATVEKVLAAALRQQEATMSRKNVAPDLIERECHALEAAIRVAPWHAVQRDAMEAARRGVGHG
jgi:hypothetical protein